MSFMTWWKQLANDSTVRVRYSHSRHGSSGKVSHTAKKDAKSDFLTFVDINLQPNNGRSADSCSATHLFLPKFRTVQTPKKGVANYDKRVQQSLVGVFTEKLENHREDAKKSHDYYIETKT